MLRAIKEKYQAWRRGEERINPTATRGRIYKSNDPNKGEVGGTRVIRVKPSATLTMTITRADGTVEVIKAPAKVKEE